MTPEQQRVAIAEVCGWTEIEPCTCCDGVSRGYTPTPGAHKKHLPDYLNDLNAMHEAVSIFDYDQTDEFEDHLCDICKRSNDEKKNPAPWMLLFALINATATQRAEAFLRTIGKWEESR